jgi:hypothetical protein
VKKGLSANYFVLFPFIIRVKFIESVMKLL